MDFTILKKSKSICLSKRSSLGRTLSGLPAFDAATSSFAFGLWIVAVIEGWEWNLVLSRTCVGKMLMDKMDNQIKLLSPPISMTQSQEMAWECWENGFAIAWCVCGGHLPWDTSGPCPVRADTLLLTGHSRETVAHLCSYWSLWVFLCWFFPPVLLICQHWVILSDS